MRTARCGRWLLLVLVPLMLAKHSVVAVPPALACHSARREESAFARPDARNRKGYSQEGSQAGRAQPVVQMAMRNVMYHFTDAVAVHIFRLDGELLSTKPDSIPVFDDKRSFIISIRSAEISISTEAMANVLNQHVFAAADAPLKKIALSTQGTSLKITGRLNSTGGIPFETVGTLSLSNEGEIRIHTEKIKAAHLSVKGLMDLVGVQLASLINTRKIRGIHTEGDDLLLNPEQILPPPQIRGRVTAVRIRGNEIVQQFGDPKASPRVADALDKFSNYMSYQGAQLRFGKLTMTDTDLVIIDMDPQDPFDFSLDHYKDQLVAGYSKTTPALGLRVYMKDLNKLSKPQTKSSPAKKE